MKIVEDFKKFALRGNLIDMAVGFTVGAAFTTVAKSLVNDIIMPPVGWAIGNVDFSNLYVVLRQGTKELPPYSPLADAQAVGAVTLNYGAFINTLISLILVAIAMFMIIRFINRLDERLEAEFGGPKPPGEPENKKCPYCRSTIANQAVRCPACTSQLEAAAGVAGP